MKKEFIVERQGRSFVMYAGLLSLAHENGLRSIRTELIQAPTVENGAVAICAATVVIDKGGVEQVYTGIGDAAENNVGPAMRSSLIRMAETRAKARALRDAVNVGVSAFEELNEMDGQEGAVKSVRARTVRQDRAVPAQAAERASAAVATAPQWASQTPAGNALVQPITAAQTNAITSLCRPRALDADALARETFESEGLASLTSVQAGELIRSLSSAGRMRVAAGMN